MPKASMRKASMSTKTAPTRNKKIPERQCVGCGQMHEKRSMYRVIRDQEANFVLDKTGRMNGRGAYLCPNPDCLKKAIKTRGLERSFKTVIPKEVYQSLEEAVLEHE